MVAAVDQVGSHREVGGVSSLGAADETNACCGSTQYPVSGEKLTNPREFNSLLFTGPRPNLGYRALFSVEHHVPISGKDTMLVVVLEANDDDD